MTGATMSRPAAAPVHGSLTGTGELIRLILRRDRVALAAWILVATAFPVLNAASLNELLASAAARAAFVAESAGNPLVTTFHGPIYSDDPAALVAWRSLLQVVFASGIGGALFMVRHTRMEEQSGRRELIASGAVGRHAPLTAVLGVVLAANAVLAALLATALSAGFGFDPAGAVAFALATTLAGWTIAVMAGIAAQVAEGAAAARGLALGGVAVLWVLRMLADSGPSLSGLRWLTPLGWAAEVRAFAGERWWVLALFPVAAALLTATAYALAARRDIGSGLLPQRPGPAGAGPGLGSALGLAWRLHRATLLIAGVAAVLVSAALGWVGAGFTGMLAASPMLAGALAPLAEAGLGDAFVAFTGYVLVALGMAVLSVAMVLRARSEESSGRAQTVLTTPTGRARWLGAHLVLAMAAPVGGALLVGACSGGLYGLGAGEPGWAAHFTGVALGHVPPALVMAGLAVLAFGAVPRLAVPLVWGFTGLSVALVGFWEGGAIPRPWFDPFTYTHPMLAPGAGTHTALLLAAAALTGAGMFAFSRRDID